MKSRFNYKSRKTIIIIVAIIALIALSATGIYVFTKGNNRTEAFTEGNTIVEGSSQTGSEGTENEPTVEEPTVEPNIDSENNEGDTVAQEPATEGTTASTTSATGTTNTTGTTTTTTGNVPNQDYVTETQVTEERLVAETFLVGWTPISLSAVTDNVELNKVEEAPSYTVTKVATLVNGETLVRNENEEITTKVRPGDIITYVITVTNTGNVTLQNITVTDELAGYEETIAVLAIGDKKEITVEYTVDQDDMDSSGTITNVAKATVPDVTDPENPDEKIEEKGEEIIPVNPNITISGSKTWVDNENKENTRPESITVEVLNGSDVVDTIEVTAEDGWKYTSKELPKYDTENKVIEYTVREKDVDSKYTESIDGTAITNTIKDEYVPTVTVTVSKKWEDGNDQDANRPESVKVQLYAGGVAQGNPVTLTAGNELQKDKNIWQYTFTGLDKYVDKNEEKPIAYTVKEVGETNGKLGDYTVTYEQSIGETVNDKIMTITNSYTPQTTSVNVTKVWVDNSNEDNDRPSSLTIRLYNGSTEVNVQPEITQQGNIWTYTFNNLPVYNAGTKINYTAKEISPEGKILDNDENYNNNYVATYSKDTLTITNTHVKPVITVTKTSTVIGNEANNKVNTGDIIEYTITVENTGRAAGNTTVIDKVLKENIESNKIVMMLNDEPLADDYNYAANTINITSNKSESTTTNVNHLAKGIELYVKSGEKYIITFRVKVEKLLPGETIVNELEGQENTNIQNDVEASITVEKKLVNPQNTVIVIDLSLSMAEAVNYSGSEDPMADSYEESRWYALTQALDSFLNTYMDGRNKVTIIGYNHTASKILITNTTNKSSAKNSYSNVLTRDQFYYVLTEEAKRQVEISDVDNLTNYGTGTLLGSGTNIDDGLRKAINILGNNINGAQVILMTDGEANRMGVNGTKKESYSGEFIYEATQRAEELKSGNATLYTVSLSLGTGNATYINSLQNMASTDENGDKLSKSAGTMNELIAYFTKISESISEQTITATTVDGILSLADGFNIDSRYVKNVEITIPNDEGVGQITLTWSDFTNYYDVTNKTINITALARNYEISGITGNVSIKINVDTTVVGNN